MATDELTEWFETADAVIVAARVLYQRAEELDLLVIMKEPFENLGSALAALAALDARDEEHADDEELEGEDPDYYDPNDDIRSDYL